MIQCGSEEKKTTTEIIASQDLASIQNKKAEVVKNLNALQLELEELNQAIGQIDKEQKFLLVTSIETESAPYAHYVSFQGTLETDQNIVMYPEIPALLKKVKVKEGQRVKKGQVLAVLSDSGMIDQLQQLEIQHALAKTTFERQKRLWEQKLGQKCNTYRQKHNSKALKRVLHKCKIK